MSQLKFTMKIDKAPCKVCASGDAAVCQSPKLKDVTYMAPFLCPSRFPHCWLDPTAKNITHKYSSQLRRNLSRSGADLSSFLKRLDAVGILWECCNYITKGQSHCVALKASM